MPPRWASPKGQMKKEHEGQVRKTGMRRHGVLNHGSEQCHYSTPPETFLAFDRDEPQEIKPKRELRSPLLLLRNLASINVAY